MEQRSRRPKLQIYLTLDINLPFHGIHSFRHVEASALISAGLDVTTVSGALGHSNSGTTLNIYSHMFQNAQVNVANAMDNAFSFLTAKDE